MGLRLFDSSDYLLKIKAKCKLTSFSRTSNKEMILVQINLPWKKRENSVILLLQALNFFARIPKPQVSIMFHLLSPYIQLLNRVNHDVNIKEFY